MNVEFDLVRAYFEENGFWVRVHEISSESGKKEINFSIFLKFLIQRLRQIPKMKVFAYLRVTFRNFPRQLSPNPSWKDTGFSADITTNDARVMKFFRNQIEAHKSVWSGKEISFSTGGKAIFSCFASCSKNLKKK